MAEAILETVQNYLKTEKTESQFLNVIVYKHDREADKETEFVNNIVTGFTNLQHESKDNVVRQYLLCAGSAPTQKQKVLMKTLEKLVDLHLITAKLLCDRALLSERLTYENKNFWLECFRLVRNVIGLVDYKGVRDIMKICREKAQTFPKDVNVNHLEQLQVLESLIKFIFDRNNCLLPAYFVANEIMKPLQFHWKFNRLLTDVVEEFRHTAQMVTIIGHTHMLPIVEHFDYAEHMVNSWKIDYNTLKFNFKGSLPYEPELLEEQTRLVRYVLSQPYCKEMVLVMLGLQKQQKQRCTALEEQLVNLIISAMEITETNENTNCPSNTGVGNFNTLTEEQLARNNSIWLHLSSVLINFVMYQFVGFINIVLSLHEKLSKLELRRGRDHLMWVLLQFISGSIQKNLIQNFLPTLKLFDLLYPEQEPLPLPDWTKPSVLRQMAPVCIWIHLSKKARIENVNINRPIPIALKKHYEYLTHLAQQPVIPVSLNNDFRIVLICNAYSTNQDHFTRPMNALVESLNGNLNKTPGGPLQSAPFSMVVLDNLTVHSKMSLIHNFVTQMIKQAQTKSSVPAPALIETYARLLVYIEIEALGIKGFLLQLLPTISKHHAWGILHILLEMFSHRLHHIPTHYRVQLLLHLHSVSASVPQTNKMQLNLCFETTALRLITGLGSVEVLPQLSRYFNEKPPSSVASTESEELNRVLILKLANSMHITGGVDELQPWCKELLSTIMQNTPHSWASHTLACFPPALSEFFAHNTHTENKQLLKKAVEEEYRNWTSMTNENDIIAHFIRQNTNLFLCLLFKMIWETEVISPVAYKILEGISARALSAHLRKLCDYLVGEVVCSNKGDFIHKFVDTINNMIWKQQVVTIDRVVLCLVLRTQEGNEAKVCFLIIQLLLLKAPEFRNRIQEFCKDNHPDHWKQSNWHEKHMSFHQKYPEKFAPDELASHPPLPVYFGNVCLRFLPVLDIVVHRFIELPIPQVHQVVEVILDHFSMLYKFHDRPITYLYNTLHFYERPLRDRPSLKKKLVSAVTGSFCDIRPPDWCVSEPYKAFLQSQDILWNPTELSYYLNLIRRLSDTISEKHIFYDTDWRFNEFSNAPTHALYVTCVELLSLPVAPQIVANNLIDAIVKVYALIPQKEIHSYINAIGVIMSALPEPYWSTIYDRLQETLNLPSMLNWNYRCNAFEMFNFTTVREAMLDKTYAVILAVAHSIFHHMGIFKLATMTRYIKEKLQPCVINEQQLIFLCHITGPFLQRIEQEKPNAVAGIAVILYELLEVVDKNHGTAPLLYMDPICDFLYHIKYIYVGNIIRNESEAIIKRLRPALQMRLRFITHLNVEEIHMEKSNVEIVNQNTAMHQQQIPTSHALQQQQQHNPNIGVNPQIGINQQQFHQQFQQQFQQQHIQQQMQQMQHSQNMGMR